MPRIPRPLLAFVTAIAVLAAMTAGGAWLITRSAVAATDGVTLDDVVYGDRLDRLVEEIAAVDGVVDVDAGPEPSSPYLRITLDPGGHPRGALRAVGEACARAREAWDPGTQPVVGEPFTLTCRVIHGDHEQDLSRAGGRWWLTHASGSRAPG